jgi:hypothetical protein
MRALVSVQKVMNAKYYLVLKFFSGGHFKCEVEEFVPTKLSLTNNGKCTRNIHVQQQKIKCRTRPSPTLKLVGL